MVLMVADLGVKQIARCIEGQDIIMIFSRNRLISLEFWEYILGGMVPVSYPFEEPD